MIDLILFAAMLASFVVGFRCGNTFGTLTEMFARAKAAVRAWFK